MTTNDMLKVLEIVLSESIIAGSDKHRIRDAVEDASRIRYVLRKCGINFEEDGERLTNGKPFGGNAPRTFKAYGSRAAFDQYATEISVAMGRSYWEGPADSKKKSEPIYKA